MSKRFNWHFLFFLFYKAFIFQTRCIRASTIILCSVIVIIDDRGSHYTWLKSIRNSPANRSFKIIKIISADLPALHRFVPIYVSYVYKRKMHTRQKRAVVYTLRIIYWRVAGVRRKKVNGKSGFLFRVPRARPHARGLYYGGSNGTRIKRKKK